MSRTTKREIDFSFSRFESLVNKDVLARRYGAGKLGLDSAPIYGGYKIVWILDSNGGQYEPFGQRRHKAAEIVAILDAMTEAYWAGLLK